MYSNRIGNFTVTKGNEAGVDLVLIQPFLLSYVNNAVLMLRDGPLEKLWWGRGIFEAQEFFSLSNSLYEFFWGHSMNIF